MTDIDKQKAELTERIRKSKFIIEGLEGNEAFRELINDFKVQAKRLDDNWQWITDEKILKEAQVTKMATLSIINTIDTYRDDMERAGELLDKIEQPDKIIAGDYDGE